MGVLESVLAYKERQRQQEEENSMGVANALNMFNQSIQVARENRLKELMFKGDLAQKGIKLNPDGSFGRDSSLESPTDALINKGKAVDAARSIGDRNLYNSLTGQKQNADSNVVSATPDDGTQYVSETDPFTQQPTARALRAKNKIELEKQKEELQQKAQVPTVQQRNDLTATENQLSNITKLRTLAEKVPAGRIQGGKSAILSSITGGEWETDTRQYLKERPAYAVSIYRALTGDTRLSDNDAKQRALPLLWHPTESAKIRKESFDTIQKALEARKRLILQGRYTQDKDGQFITPLEDVLAEAQQSGNVEEDKSVPSQNPPADNPQLKELISGLPTDFGPNKVDLNKLLENSISPGANFLNSALGIPFTDISPKGLIEKLGYSYPEGNDTPSKIGDVIGSAAGTFANVPFRAAGSLLGLLKAGKTAQQAETIAKATEPVAKEATTLAQTIFSKTRPYEKVDNFIRTAREAVYGKQGYLRTEGEIYKNSLSSLKGSNKVVKSQQEIVNTIRSNFSSNTGNMLTPQLKEQVKVLESLAKKGKLTEGKIVDVMKNIANKGSSEQAAINKQAVSVLGKYLKGDTAKKWSLMQTRYSNVMKNIERVSRHIGIERMPGGGEGKQLEGLITRMINSSYDKNALDDLQIIGNLSNQPNLAKAVNTIQAINDIGNKGSFTIWNIPKNFTAGMLKLKRGVPPLQKDIAVDTENTLLKQITKFPKKK